MLQFGETLLRSISLALAVMFVVAIGHKATVLASSGASRLPILRQGRFRTEWPAFALGVALVAEVAVTAALLVAPTVGYITAAGLLLIYARLVAEMPQGEPCDCFGSLSSRQTAGKAVRRNIALAGVAIAAAAICLAGVPPAAFGASAIGIASLIIAPALAVALLGEVGPEAESR